MTFRSRFVAAAALAGSVIAGSTATLAHHPTGGMMPTSFFHGLLSGIGHPIIGLDHLSFVIGIGLLARIAGFGLALPALFVVAMLAGLLLHVAGATIPLAELLLAGSVALIGLAVWIKRPGRGSWLEAGAFALAGVLHGYAFAEAVIGAETTPIVAYVLGLAATQMAIAGTAYFLAGGGSEKPMLSPALVRSAGVAIAVIGVAFAMMHGFTA